MSATDPRPSGEGLTEILEANRAFAADHSHPPLPAAPARRLAVLTCMDARLDLEGALGLRRGDAHIVRNAGGLATDDAIRSLVVGVHQLGVRRVLVIEHTGCGMLGLAEDALRDQLANRTGVAIDLPMHGFTDLEANLRTQVERLRTHPWLEDAAVEGLIYDADTGLLTDQHETFRGRVTQETAGSSTDPTEQIPTQKSSE